MSRWQEIGMAQQLQRVRCFGQANVLSHWTINVLNVIKCTQKSDGIQNYVIILSCNRSLKIWDGGYWRQVFYLISSEPMTSLLTLRVLCVPFAYIYHEKNGSISAYNGWDILMDGGYKSVWRYLKSRLGPCVKVVSATFPSLLMMLQLLHGLLVHYMYEKLRQNNILFRAKIGNKLLNARFLGQAHSNSFHPNEWRKLTETLTMYKANGL